MLVSRGLIPAHEVAALQTSSSKTGLLERKTFRVAMKRKGFQLFCRNANDSMSKKNRREAPGGAPPVSLKARGFMGNRGKNS
jgi:hypothetical protein